MHDEPVHIETLRTTSACPDRISCPAVRRTNLLPGGKLMQGKKIPDEVRAALVAMGMPPDEDAVWQPDELIPEV